MTAKPESSPPLTTAAALKEEFIKLHGAPALAYHAWLDQLPEAPALWLFAADHFLNPTAWIDELIRPRSPLLLYLKNQLPPALLARLEHVRRRKKCDESTLTAFHSALNAILTNGDCIYTAERFAGINLTPVTQAWLAASRSGLRLTLLNRVLLEEAFPQQIVRVWDTLGGVFSLCHAKERTALCFSGGGIRSATFNFGVLQGLARLGLLERFDYLSTVSGGGYIGGWLTSWIHHAKEQTAVNPTAFVNAGLADCLDHTPLQTEAKPIQHLRQFSNYLTPKLGLLSADTWTLVGTYLRNLLLNWLVFAPFVVVAIGLPRIVVAVHNLSPQPWVVKLVFALGFFSGVIGIAYTSLQRPSLSRLLRAHSPFWFKRGEQRDFILWGLGPLLGTAICFCLYWAWLPGSTFALPSLIQFAGVAVALHALGWLLSRALLRSLNVLEFVVVIATGAVGGGLLWWTAQWAFRNLNVAPDLEFYVVLAVPVFLLIFLATATMFIGLTSRQTTDSDREWWARMGAWILIAAVGWLLGGSLVVFAPLGLLELPKLVGALGALSGVFTLWAGHSGKTEGTRENEHAAWIGSRLLNGAMMLAAPLFVIALAAGISLGTSWILYSLGDFQGAPFIHLSMVHRSDPSVVHDTDIFLLLELLSTLVLFGLLMSLLININRFSLHAVYRNRIIRAYLGATNPVRQPNPFTGFDPHDNIPLCNLEQRPFHVLNLALNLVGGENLAWQQRKAETFTASPLHCGNFRLGYRRSAEYAQGERGNGISIGTAVTISGAAASPNMGYHSSPVVAMLMTVFNVRLGAWLGNPGSAGDKTFTHAAPRSPVWHLLKESLGLTDDQSPYVYLSDGGHFENLGLYEMVLRRCHLIVVGDAGCDPHCSLEDLGNAIRKIRVDLGVPIEVERFNILCRSDPKAADGKYCAIGRIDYRRVDGPQAKIGVLVYLKPALCGKEPQDIFNYKEVSPEFPHESTGDQWFSESQFESYRMLGQHIVRSMAYDWTTARRGESKEQPLVTFVKQAHKYLDISIAPDIRAQLEQFDQDSPEQPPDPDPMPRSASPTADTNKSSF